MKFQYIFYLILLICCFNAKGQVAEPILSQKEGLKEWNDFKYALKNIHIAPFRFSSKDSIESILDSLEQKIEGNISVFDLYAKMQYATAKVKDGHTRVYNSMRQDTYLDSNNLRFPLYVKVIGQKLFVRINCSNEDGINDFDEITSINGVTSAQIIQDLIQYTFNDGTIDTAIEDALTYQFYDIFNYCYMRDSSYEVNIRKAQDEKIYKYILTGSNIKRIDSIYEKRILENRTKSFVPISSSFIDKTAYLKIKTFDHRFAKKNYNVKLTSFIDDFFEKCQINAVNNLIIDLRGNTGGTETMANYLYGYLSHQNFQHLEFVRTKDDFKKHPFKVRPFSSGGFLERLLTTKKGQDGFIYRRPKTVFGIGLYALVKKNEPLFNGKIYVIMDGNSYSTTSYFLELMYLSNRATFIGKPAGAHFYDGNTQAWFEHKFKNSGIKLWFPLWEKKLKTNRVKEIPYGKSIQPNFYVADNIDDFRNNIDTQLEFVYDLINK